MPKPYHGRLIGICMGFISSNKEKVAVKAFSLTVLHQLCGEYPEIIDGIK